MRPLIVLAALAWTPALAAAPPLCTLPAPGAIPVADNHAEASTTAPPTGPPARSTEAWSPLPDALASMPFVQHVASAGAVVTDLGEAHGMRVIAARSGDQFMLFQVTSDGQAAVSGAPVELTPVQLEAIASGSITSLDVRHGLSGFFVRSGPQFQVFYATPDHARLIPGVMWDAAGKDLTRQQVAHIPGAIPTVVVGGAEPGQSSSSAAAVASLPLVQKASFGTDRPAFGAAPVHADRPAMHLFGPRLADAGTLFGERPIASLGYPAIRIGQRGSRPELAERARIVE